MFHEINTYVPIFFQLVSAGLTAFIALVALRSYYISREKKFFWYGTGFLLITFSFIALFLSRSFSLSSKICPTILEGLIPYYGHLLYTLLFAFGSIILSLVYAKIKDYPTLYFVGGVLFLLVFMIHANFFYFSILMAGIYFYVSSKVKPGIIRNSFVLLGVSYILFAVSTYFYFLQLIPFALESFAYFMITRMIIRIK